MKIFIISLFPDSLKPILNSSILARAQKKGLVDIETVDLRQFGEGIHQTVDDRPYGGGAGMVLKPDVLQKAVQTLTKGNLDDFHIILTSAQGNKFSQKKARELSKKSQIIIICGHYEGVDQRFIDKYVNEEISIGDYVLTGGELPSLIITDSIVRLIPKVLEKEEATIEESFENNLLEYPHYTRPEEFEGEKVPEVLLSGNHPKIADWRKTKSVEKTKIVRPDLLKRV
jgi:tRNA (guanine37-N1)-methyltransferase